MNYKKTTYVILTTILGVLLSIIVHGLSEIVLISLALQRGAILIDQGGLTGGYGVLSQWLQATMLIGGAVGGYYLGFYWWRVVYIEHRHWRMKHQK